MFELTGDWKTLLDPEMEKDYFVKMLNILKDEYESQDVFPPKEDVFSAFNMTGFREVKVVILGQDPYHDVGQAHGLCFSVNKGIKIPPSLRNIYKELNSDLNCRIPSHGNLEKWAKQGVLMINAVLTVRAHEAASHSKIGWTLFTDQVITMLNERKDPLIFLLWGNYARTKKKLITNTRHIIIESAHPSPLSASRGFFGSKPFSRINLELRAMGKDTIDWQIDDADIETRR